MNTDKNGQDGLEDNLKRMYKRLKICIPSRLCHEGIIARRF